MRAPLSRRQLLGATLAMTLASRAGLFAADAKPPRRVVLRSHWQRISVGDLAQTPGAIRLIQRHWPETDISCWLAQKDDALAKMLPQSFPKVNFVSGTIDSGTLGVEGAELRDALHNADLVMHNSAVGLPTPQLLAWCQANRKPSAVLGLSLQAVDDRVRSILANARCVYGRDAPSLEILRRASLEGPKLGIFPDSAFGFDLRDEPAATTYLKSVRVEPGKFVCVVPRLRYTPFKNFPPDEIRRRTQTSERFAEPDHAKLRAAIVASVREREMRVLVCPEMTYQTGIIDKHVIEALPADVRAHVVKRDTFWMPDEAASVYARAAAVLSLEAHAAILALASGTPAMHLRLPTDFRHGHVLREMSLNAWFHEIEDVTGDETARGFVKLLADRLAAQAKVTDGMKRIAELHAERFAEMARSI